MNEEINISTQSGFTVSYEFHISYLFTIAWYYLSPDCHMTALHNASTVVLNILILLNFNSPLEAVFKILFERKTKNKSNMLKHQLRATS